MKLVVYTQIKENYGLSSTGQEIWKNKGGDTYIFQNLSPKQIEKINKKGIPILTSLITADNTGYKEYVTSFEIVPDDKVVCEEWEDLWFLKYSSKTGWTKTQKAQRENGGSVAAGDE